MTPETQDTHIHTRGRSARHALVLGSGILVSRALGLVRDILMAGFLGTGHVADAWLVAMRIPNVLRLHLSEGSLNSAFVPVVAEYSEKRGPAETRRFISASVGVVTLVFLAISLVGALASPVLAPLVAPGFSDVPGKLGLTSRLMVWAFAFLFLVGLAAVMMSILQAVGHFRASAIAQIPFNAVLILSILFVCPLFGQAPEKWVYGLVVGSIASAVIQIAIQIRPLKHQGLLVRPRLDFRHPGVARVGRLTLPTLAGVAIAELAIIANTLLASLLEHGAVSSMEYATRIVQVPYSIVAGGLATAILPLCARQAARGDFVEFQKTISISLRVGLFVMVPMAVLTFLLGTDAVRLLLERGAFDPDSTRRTGLALEFFAPLMVGATTLRVLTFAFFSIQDTRTPVRAAAAALALNLVLGIALMKPMGVAGLSLAAGLAPCLASAYLARSLGRRLGAFPGNEWRRTLLVLVAGSVCVVGGVLATERLFPPASGSSTFLMLLVRVAVPAGAGLVSYLAVARLLRAPEIGYVASTLRGRRGDV